jgi:CHAT domain
MARYSSVKLELIRPGPAHNQLLSPLTPYMALCGEGAPITFHVGLEHHSLLSQLERLRYVTPEGGSAAAVPNRVREATVAEVGEDVAGILSEIHTLLAEVSRARGEASEGTDGEHNRFVHLRLVLGGSELALIPFEMAVSPQSFPGEGLQFCLQLDMPVILTRETRRSRPLPTAWDQPVEPKVLLVSAAPGGLDVPLAAHVHAIRAAMEPWIRWPKQEVGADPAAAEPARLEFVKARLRLLPNASLEEIYDTCAQDVYTHIHVLAHGSQYEVAGERRFGIALCARGDPATPQVVSGWRLAKALQAEEKDGSTRSHPVMVTLALCDSGHQGSMLVPGGSIAHELHAAGIPWVFASQFPLTKVGSVRMAEALYSTLLRGDDPRQVLYEVRRRLYMSAERDHDWASVVAYASVPGDFEEQVDNFFVRQTIRAIETCLERADNTADNTKKEEPLNDVQRYLTLWRGRLPTGPDVRARSRRARCYGIHGSTYKRIGLLHLARGERDTGKTALQEALRYYRQAMQEWSMDENNHYWASTQALSLGAVLGEAPDADTHHLACVLASRDLEQSLLDDRAWAHGTLAELKMLELYHRRDRKTTAADIQPQVVGHCKHLLELMGAQSFHVVSTRRQFQRYVDYWSEQWGQIAEAAVRALQPPAMCDSVSPLSDFPSYV